MASKARQQMEMKLKSIRRQKAKNPISPFGHKFMIITDDENCELVIVDENNHVVAYILAIDSDGMKLFKNKKNFGIKTDKDGRILIKSKKENENNEAYQNTT